MSKLHGINKAWENCHNQAQSSTIKHNKNHTPIKWRAKAAESSIGIQILPQTRKKSKTCIA
jgi:hypothetical protein